MKILHTADWHIGKVVNEFSLIEDQKFIIEKLFAVIELERPDVIIISGDIYDRSIPPKEAVELLDFTLTKLVDHYKIPTLVLSGNHDSSERLSFGNKLLEEKKLYIQGSIEEIKKITFNDEYGIINFFFIPYVHPMIVRNIYNDQSINDHNDAMQAIVKRIADDCKYNERNILITHNYIISCDEEMKLSESERSLSIGGTEFVDVNIIKDFDYVALGHLHKPQKVKFEHIRYPGSLLKYSFSEVDYNKGVNIVHIKEKNNIQIQFIELKPKRDMKIIKGKLEELTSEVFYNRINCEDYICAILTDENDIYDPISSLRAIYPNIMQIQRNNIVTNIESSTKASANFKEKTKIELFDEFYNKIITNELDDKKRDILGAIINNIEKEGGF